LKVNYHKTMKNGKIRPLTPETGVQVPVGLPNKINTLQTS